MNSENWKTSDRYILVLNIAGKIDLQRSGKYAVLSNLSISYIWKNIQNSYKNYI